MASKEDLMREAFLAAHKQLQDHRNQKIDYLQREKKDRSWKDKDHPARPKPHEEERNRQQEQRLEALYRRHGWGGEKD